MSKSAITFRQLIQSLKDYDDQLASVMPYAEDAETPAWGISEIWFEDGILMIGQYDDEGDYCEKIAARIEACIPKDMLDKPAIVKIGTVEGDEDDRQIYDINSEPAMDRTVISSEVKRPSAYIEGFEEFEDECELDDDDDFCKWVLKFE